MSPCWSTSPLIISGHPNYPPYMWNQDGTLVGIGPELARTICKELNLTCEIRPVDSWKRVQELARTGDIDLIVGAYSNEDRREYMKYSIPHLIDPTNIFVARGRSFPFASRE